MVSLDSRTGLICSLKPAAAVQLTLPMMYLRSIFKVEGQRFKQGLSEFATHTSIADDQRGNAQYSSDQRRVSKIIPAHVEKLRRRSAPSSIDATLQREMESRSLI